MEVSIPCPLTFVKPVLDFKICNRFISTSNTYKSRNSTNISRIYQSIMTSRRSDPDDQCVCRQSLGEYISASCPADPRFVFSILHYRRADPASILIGNRRIPNPAGVSAQHKHGHYFRRFISILIDSPYNQLALRAQQRKVAEIGVFYFTCLQLGKGRNGLVDAYYCRPWLRRCYWPQQN